MSVYRKFSRNDILYSTIHARPRISVSYGSEGWMGSTGPSASLSLYSGVRSRFDVRSGDISTSGLSVYPLDPLDTHSIDKVVFVSGSYPSTGSIRFVRCEDRPFASFTDVTSEHWFDEHFSPIKLLYEYYGRYDTNYFLGNYDFYTPLFLRSSSSVGPFFVFSGAFTSNPIADATSSFTIEAWVKPVATQDDLDVARLTVLSQPGVWSLALGSASPVVSGTVAVSLTSGHPTNPVNVLTGSVHLGVWSHVAVAVTTGSNIAIYVDGVPMYDGPLPSGSFVTGSVLKPLVVGAYFAATGPSSASFDGFISETRAWNVVRTRAQIISALSGTLLASSSAGLVHYARYNDGPYGTAHGFVSGSGAFDHSPTAAHGYAVPYTPTFSVHWQPGDHPTFIPALKKTNLETKDIRVIHVPSMFYGRQIDLKSVVVMDGVYNSRKIVRTFNDDGQGGLYVSGSMTRDISGEDYQGQPRRKVGNIFYTEGLIVFTDPALHDMFDNGSLTWNSNMHLSGVFEDLISIDFRGQTRVHTKTINCRMGSAQCNASNNLTFSHLDDMGTEATDDDRAMVVGEVGTTYITAIGIYNEDRDLVAVAKIAQPIRKREKDKLNLKIKLDF